MSPFNRTLLDNPWIKDEVKRKIRNSLKKNEKWNPWDIVKTVLNKCFIIREEKEKNY